MEAYLSSGEGHQGPCWMFSLLLYLHLWSAEPSCSVSLRCCVVRWVASNGTAGTKETATEKSDNPKFGSHHIRF